MKKGIGLVQVAGHSPFKAAIISWAETVKCGVSYIIIQDGAGGGRGKGRYTYMYLNITMYRGGYRSTLFLYRE